MRGCGAVGSLLRRNYLFLARAVITTRAHRTIFGRTALFAVLSFFNNHGHDATNGRSNNSAFGVIFGRCCSHGGGNGGGGHHHGGALGGAILFGITHFRGKVVDIVEAAKSVHRLIHGSQDGGEIDGAMLFRVLLRIRLGRRLFLIKGILRLGKGQAGSDESNDEGRLHVGEFHLNR